MKRTLPPVLCLVLATTLGCGDDDDAGGDGDDGGDPVDAAVAIDADETPDAAPVAVDCNHIQTLYGDLGAVTADAVVLPQDEEDPSGFKFLRLAIPLNEESPPDVLFVELWEDAAPFLPLLEPATVTIIEDQTDAFSCGTCVYVAGDFVDGQNVNFYMARSGQVVIDEVDPTPGTGTLRGSISNITVREIEIVPGVGQQEVQDGCVATIDSATFDVGVVAPAAATSVASPLRQARSAATVAR